MNKIKLHTRVIYVLAIFTICFFIALFMLERLSPIIARIPSTVMRIVTLMCVLLAATNVLAIVRTQSVKYLILLSSCIGFLSAWFIIANVLSAHE